ncbi:Reverse transcriptase (RNA-dependent DNA polymerase) [Popillia japonica]|uniref:Reverse transcriptase (RNA-dependent DNA polymerase) n=1 Tax=Popillia japonica TaxID=7064 RepID=A0AAW1JL60_POPJA
MEKLLEKHLRQTSLLQRPLHPNQHAYQSGKSCDSALHQLVSRVEASINNQEIALVAFLDIEGAFDNTSFKSMIRAASNRGVEDTICKWIKAMLEGQLVETSLAGETMQVTVRKGCPQGGVLSPLLWDLVIDELLVTLNDEGYYTQGCADDIAILIVGKNASTISELMQRALTRTEGWCGQEHLRVNPAKATLVPFTKIRKLDGLKPPILHNEPVQFNQETKFLGLVLDSKLTWNQRLEQMIDKCNRALMTIRRTIGKAWGLKPRMMHWLYTAVVRPMLTYSCLIWWTKATQKQAIAKLAKVQRLACLCITGAAKSTPTADMETMLNLLPLDIYIRGKARIGAHRLKWGGNWRTQNRILRGMTE